MGLGAPQSVLVSLRAYGNFTMSSGADGSTVTTRIRLNGIDGPWPNDGNMAVNGKDAYY